MPRRPIKGRAYAAARCYGGFTRKQLGKRLGLSESTVKRREYGTQGAKQPELEVVADICKVPLAFLEGGFPALGLKQPEAGRLPEPRGELGHRLEDDQPTPEDQREDGHPGAADSQ